VIQNSRCAQHDCGYLTLSTAGLVFVYSVAEVLLPKLTSISISWIIHLSRHGPSYSHELRSFSLVFWEKEWSVRGRPLLPEILDQPLAVFHLKSHFARRKSATKLICMTENCQRQSCRAFIGLTIPTKMIGGGRSIKRIIALTKLLLGAACDECSICIAIITMEYQITNNVH